MPLEPSSVTGPTPSSTGSDTAVVICNGPSLASVSNEWLDQFPTFGSNRVWLKYTPNVLATLDLKMVHNRRLQEEMLAGFAGVDEIFVSGVVADRLGRDNLPDNCHEFKAWNNLIHEDGTLQPGFSINP
ncbi:MAG: hypothetical protein QQN63_13485, partial [Nitrosopumilus sp.]